MTVYISTFGRLLVTAALICFTASCAAPKDKGMADIKLNTNPQKKNKLTFSIQDAPGAFSLAKAFATYEVTDKACLPPADNFQGVQMAKSTYTVPLELSKDAGDSYVATVAEDAISSSDLYGHGLCNWKLTSAHIRLSASGRSEDTGYVAALPIGDLAEARSLTLYYLKSSYPSTGNQSVPDHGIEDVALLNPAVPAAGWFTITVSSTELTP